MSNKPDAPKVTVFRKQLIIFVTLMGGGPALIWGGGAIAIWLLGVPWIQYNWMWLLAGPLQVGTCVWWIRAVSRLRRLVRETGGMLCPRCGYDLRGRADETLCSECGLRVSDGEIDEAWREWKKHYGSAKEQAAARGRESSAQGS